MGNKIKVLLTYIVYPLAMGTYFRKALQHRDDVDLRVAGIYTGAWIPWKGGLTLPSKYANPPDYPLPLSLHINEYNYDMLKPMMGDWVPDLIIQVDAGFHAKYKPMDGMVVTVATDPHAIPPEFYDVPRAYSDKFFNMQAVYSKKGDVYLPYAYSRHDFYPELKSDGGATGIDELENSQKDVDAVLVGMPYEQRVQWVTELRKRNVSVIFENGPILDEARALYNRGAIGLNWSSLDDLNCRAFELPAMKLYPVMNWVTDMNRKEFGFIERCGIFHNLSEAVEQVMWAIENPEKAHTQAELAYQDVVPHTYDRRVRQILTECGF
jgi:hypothetical protein